VYDEPQPYADPVDHGSWQRDAALRE
jgi:hypothetical protein